MPMIRVIRIEREYGSGAADIAKKVADRLGWKLWDQALTDEIARRMDCDSQTVAEHEERRAAPSPPPRPAVFRGRLAATSQTPPRNAVGGGGAPEPAPTAGRAPPKRLETRSRVRQA